MGMPNKFMKEKSTKAEEIKQLSNSEVLALEMVGWDGTWAKVIDLLLAAVQGRRQGWVDLTEIRRWRRRELRQISLQELDMRKWLHWEMPNFASVLGHHPPWVQTGPICMRVWTSKGRSKREQRESVRVASAAWSRLINDHLSINYLQMSRGTIGF